MARTHSDYLVYSLILSMAVCVGVLAAGDDKCVPFILHGSPTSVEVSGGPPPLPLLLTIAASGEGTHLGAYSSSASFMVVFLSPTSAIFIGGGTLTAADGDEIYFCFSGDFYPGPTAGGAGRFEITGGTGRFEDVTGSGDFYSMNNETTFDGEICLKN